MTFQELPFVQAYGLCVYLVDKQINSLVYEDYRHDIHNPPTNKVSFASYH